MGAAVMVVELGPAGQGGDVVEVAAPGRRAVGFLQGDDVRRLQAVNDDSRNGIELDLLGASGQVLDVEARDRQTVAAERRRLGFEAAGTQARPGLGRGDVPAPFETDCPFYALLEFEATTDETAATLEQLRLAIRDSRKVRLLHVERIDEDLAPDRTAAAAE